MGVASSGIYSVVGFTLFALFVAYIAKGSILRRVVLFGLGFPILLLLNIARLVIIIGAANYLGITAFNIFHFTSGIVLVFVVTLVLLAVGDKFFKLQFFSPSQKVKPCPYCKQEYGLGHSFCLNCGRFYHSSKSSFSKHVLISFLTIALVLVIFLSSLTPAVAAAETPGSVNLTSLTPQSEMSLLPQVHGWNLSFVFRDTQIEEILQQDAALQYAYTSLNSSGGSNAQLIVTVQISSTIHTPEDSLIQQPLLRGESPVTVFEDRDVQILSSPPLAGRMFIYNSPGTNDTIADFYWNLRSIFNFGSYSDFRNVQIGIVTSTSNLAAWGIIHNATDFDGVTKFYLPFAQYIAKFWESQSTTSLLAAGIKQWFSPLLVIAISPSAIFFGLSLYWRKKDSKLKLGSYRDLYPKDKQLFEAVSLASKEKLSTLDNILTRYTQMSNKEMSPSDVYLSLVYAEKLGFVKRVFEDSEGLPIQVWHNTFDWKNVR